MKRASYKEAIRWIAENDETSEDNEIEMSSLVSVLLVSDLWGKDPLAVAKDICKMRKNV